MIEEVTLVESLESLGCGRILPFNWPPIHTGGKFAPAIATGEIFHARDSICDLD